MDGDLVTQIGLMLTQLRYARRALEDIERSTQRYTTFAFAGALSVGPGFGAPPMFGGALKVHVVNINDLAPGGGMAGLLEGLLGGVGRFFGGLFGGFVGGTIGGIALPVMIAKIETIVAAIERISARLGTSKEPVPGTGQAAKPAEANGGLLGKLDEIKGVVDSFTALFQAAAGQPKQAGETANPLTPAGERWLRILETANMLISGISLVIKGLTLLIPEVIGAIAYLFNKLDAIKLAVIELLQFILKEALLLRGVALTVLFDTLSAAAKLAANVLGILGVTISDVIKSIFGIFNSVFDAALAAIDFLSKGLAATVDALLKWLTQSVITVLTVLGDTRVFRVAVYAIQSLPYILPSLIQLKNDRTISKEDQEALDNAKKLTIAPPAAPGASAVTLPLFPQVSATLLDPDAVKALHGTIDKSQTTVTTLMGQLFDDTSKGMQRLGDRLDAAASDKVFNEALEKHTKALSERASALADALAPAQEKAEAAGKQPSGFGVIAKAYEDWLSSDTGLKSLLGHITDFIKETPTSGPQAEASLPAKVKPLSMIDRPRATVEIDDLVIQLAPPPERELPGGVPGVMKALSDHSPEEFLRAIVELMHEMDQRGMSFGPGSLALQA
jgi:hypothetical protein